MKPDSHMNGRLTQVLALTNESKSKNVWKEWLKDSSSYIPKTIWRSYILANRWDKLDYKSQVFEWDGFGWNG